MANTYNLLNAVRSALRWEDRIPEINKDTLHNLTTLAPDEMNAFINVMVKVVKQEIYSTTFNREDNPFADFFREMLPAGYAIEDLYVDLIAGAVPAWNDDGSFALSRKKPKVSAIYHKQNYEMQYKVSTSYPQIKSAFLSVEGIDNLLATINATLYSSCEYDLYLQCIELLSTAYHNGAIIPQYGVDISTEAGIKAFLKRIKNAVKEFGFMNTEYNGMKYATRSNKNDVVVIVRSDVRDTLDVDYLAGAYNLSKVELESRIIEVPKNYGFGSYSTEANPIYAMVIDKRFMKVIPTLYEGSAIMNPASLVTNTFLTTAWVFSYACFINAVAFVGGEAPSHNVTVATSAPVTVDKATAKFGDELTVTATADVAKPVFYTSPDGFDVVIVETLANGDTVSFAMPNYAVEIKVQA